MRGSVEDTFGINSTFITPQPVIHVNDILGVFFFWHTLIVALFLATGSSAPYWSPAFAAHDRTIETKSSVLPVSLSVMSLTLHTMYPSVLLT